MSIWNLIKVGIALTLPVALHAEQLTVVLDPAKTQINWLLSGTVHTVHGTFRLKSGTILIDTANGKISGSIIVDATSGESGSSSRDRRMHSEVLQSARFPEINFIPAKIDGFLSSSSKAQVTGSFQLHGSSHEMTIPVEVSISQDLITAHAKFSVPYVNWGLKDPSNFLLKVDKAVEVDLVTESKAKAK